MALFQLACVTGDWKRARTQLDTIAGLDPEAALMAKLYMSLINAEAARAEVFAGRLLPVTLGEPPTWLAMLAQALRHNAAGEEGAAQALRRQALGLAEPMPGALDDQPFAWIMDADPRLGPVLEVVVNGEYRWLPFRRLRELRAEAPKAMRDLIWQPAEIVLGNDSALHVFLPVRYPGSEGAADDAIRLARATSWTERPTGEQIGLGQRLLATDQGDRALLDIRHLVIGEPSAEGGG
jgi:type VI secretion system protein ImpE